MLFRMILMLAFMSGCVTPGNPVDDARHEFDARLAKGKADYERERAATPPAQVLRLDVMYMVAIDQYARNFINVPHERGFSAEERQQLMTWLIPRWTEIDRNNTEALKKILAAHGGWLKISEFGADVDHSAWLLVQHADQDPAFQREVLARLEKLWPKGETSRSNFAYLWDRVASAEKRPQRYGTQGRCVGVGTWEPNPVEKPEAELDARRAEVGLGSMAEYKARFKTICHGKDG